MSRDGSGHGVKLAKALGARVTGFFAAPPATPWPTRGLLPVGLATPEKNAAMIEKAAEAAISTVIESAARAAGVRCKTIHVTKRLSRGRDPRGRGETQDAT